MPSTKLRRAVMWGGWPFNAGFMSCGALEALLRRHWFFAVGWLAGLGVSAIGYKNERRHCD